MFFFCVQFFVSVVNKLLFFFIDCKIGRQSNLFKQNLKSAIDNKTNQMSNMACNNSGQANSMGGSTLLEMSQSSTFNYVTLDPSSQAQFLANNYDVEDSLDLNTKLLVKKIHQEYKVLENIPENIVYQNYGDYELALELIKMHTGNCINFISNISCNYWFRDFDAFNWWFNLGMIS